MGVKIEVSGLFIPADNSRRGGLLSRMRDKGEVKSQGSLVAAKNFLNGTPLDAGGSGR
jgi:hypothetical protein